MGLADAAPQRAPRRATQANGRPIDIRCASEWKRRLRDAAPDLWSVRSLVLDLPGNEGRPATDHSNVSEEASKAADDPEHVTNVEEAQAALHRLEGMPSPDANALVRLHMYMASALLADDRASEATEHADKAVANARENTRIRAQALTVAAHAKLREANDVSAALEHLQHATGVWRSILNRDGDTPQTLRDLSLSLDEVGRIREAAGETDAARAIYEESLAIDRGLTETVGETPQRSVLSLSRSAGWAASTNTRAKRPRPRPSTKNRWRLIVA